MASLYGKGNFGAGLYSADPLQLAAVSFAIPIAATIAASVGILTNAAVAWGIPVSVAVQPDVLALGAVAWSIPLEALIGSAVVVFGALDWLVGVEIALSDDVYGGLYWSGEGNATPIWTPVPTDDPFWTPISVTPV